MPLNGLENKKWLQSIHLTFLRTDGIVLNENTKKMKQKKKAGYTKETKATSEQEEYRGALKNKKFFKKKEKLSRCSLPFKIANKHEIAPGSSHDWRNLK